jgi:hypothetical protein
MKNENNCLAAGMRCSNHNLNAARDKKRMQWQLGYNPNNDTGTL